MSSLTIYKETGEAIEHTKDPIYIANQLDKVGVLFKRWPARHTIHQEMSNEDILKAYQEDIALFVKEGGYSSFDVASIHPMHPDKEMLRKKFLSEHIHTEDEIRFFVAGQGLFSLHIGDKIYVILCCQNDLISVPAGVPHWFDMGKEPKFTALRFFNHPDGWTAKYTGSTIAEKFPLLDTP